MIIGRGASVLSRAAVSVAALGLLAGCAADPLTADSPTAAAAAAPTHAASATPTPATSTPPPSHVVTLGDSLMSGFGLPAREAWPRLLADHARLPLVNLACPGMGFVVQGDCGTPYAGLVPAIAALQPDVVIVQSSSNDFWIDSDEIRYDTADTVENLHAAAPGARIIALSTIWNDDPEVPDDTAVTSDALRDAVEAVGGTYVDVGQPLAGHPELMQEDDVHPTARGQKVIEQSVMTALQDAGVTL